MTAVKQAAVPKPRSGDIKRPVTRRGVQQHFKRENLKTSTNPYSWPYPIHKAGSWP